MSMFSGKAVGGPKYKETTLPFKHASIANVVLNACYELSTVERRIIFIILSHMDSSKELDSNKDYAMNVEDYAKLCSISIKDAYETLKDNCDKLFDRRIVIHGLESKKSKKQIRWIQSITFIPETHEIKVKWASDIIPFISQLTSNFTRLLNKDYIPIESKYASRLYDLLYQEKWKGHKGKKEIYLDDLIALWCIPESCQEFKFLKSRILVPAIKELEERQLAKIELIVGKKENRKTKSVILKYWVK